MSKLRSMSNTNITFGPITAPVKMYAATEDTGPSFHLYHVHDDGSASRVSMPCLCNDCGAIINNRADLVRGAENGESDVILLNNDEIASVESECGKDFEILSFCHEDEIDPLRYESPYYLEPDIKRGKAAALKSYALLRTALQQHQRVGIVKYAMRSKTHLAILRVVNEMLVIQNILWDEQLRKPQFETLERPVEISEQELKLTSEFMDLMVEEFDPAKYVDEVSRRVQELLEAKAAGLEVAPRAEKEAVEDVGDLVAALQKSVAKAKAAKADAELEQSVEAHPAGRRTRKAKTA